MNRIVCKNYEEMSAVAAEIIAQQVKSKPKSVLGLATGSTPIGTYKRLVEIRQSDPTIDFSQVTTFNLDEYYPIKRTHDQSYFCFMNENLFKHVNILPENINIPNGETADPIKECTDYDARLAEFGGTDLQILGIGNNGHIAFVEPNENLGLATSVVSLTADTINANSRFFEKAEDVPKQALSMGLYGIFNSRHILLLISGKGKAAIAKKLFDGVVTTQVPASLLNLHSNVTVIMDNDAATLD